jgi:hypothetical protein
MTISDRNRAQFEAIGLSAIRRELAVGNNYYLPIDAESQRQAREWVNEKLEEQRREKATDKRWQIIIGGAGLVAAVAACIAAWPIVKAWFGG